MQPANHLLFLSLSTLLLSMPAHSEDDKCSAATQALLRENARDIEEVSAVVDTLKASSSMRFVQKREDLFEGLPQTQRAVESLNEKNSAVTLIPEYDLLPRALQGGTPRTLIVRLENVPNALWIESETMLAKYESLREAYASFYATMAGSGQWVESAEIAAATKRVQALQDKHDRVNEEYFAFLKQKSEELQTAKSDEKKLMAYWKDIVEQDALQRNIKANLEEFKKLEAEWNRFEMHFVSVQDLNYVDGKKVLIDGSIQTIPDEDLMAEAVVKNYYHIRKIFGTELDQDIDLKELHGMVENSGETFFNLPKWEFKNLDEFHQLEGPKGHISKVTDGKNHLYPMLLGDALTDVFFSGKAQFIRENLQKELFAEIGALQEQLNKDQPLLKETVADKLMAMDSVRRELLSHTQELIEMQEEEYAQYASSTVRIDWNPEGLEQLAEIIAKLTDEIKEREALVRAQSEKNDPSLEFLRFSDEDNEPTDGRLFD